MVNYRFWVTTNPSPQSTLADCVFDTDAAGFARQVRGGLDEAHEPRWFTTEAQAYLDLAERCDKLSHALAVLRDRAREAAEDQGPPA